jgi:superfamily I DNA and/or RNA helicase
VQQLPPIVLGPRTMTEEALPERSILAHLLAAYSPAVRVRLNETYRLNQELCVLPSRLWYQGDLQPAPANATTRLALPVRLMNERARGARDLANATTRLALPVRLHTDLIDTILAPEQPLTLVLAEHTTDTQQSLLEVEIVTALAVRLLLDYGIAAERLAILAPHRAQNSAITHRLALQLAACGTTGALPVIDTVERLQGAERDVVLFSLTTSDADHRASPFLNNPNRFNVAITRARHKLVVVGSPAFFTQVPHTAEGLQAHHCFTAYYDLCREQGALFAWPPASTTST